MTLAACRDEGTLVVNPDDIPKGAFVYMDVESAVLNVTDLTGSKFAATVYAPSENVSNYDIKVSWVSGGNTSDTVDLKSYNAFPASVEINASELAAALGVTMDDFLPGDAFNVVCTVTSTDGKEVTIEQLDEDAAGNPGQRQAFNYTTYISCPFNASDAAGTYEATVDDFGTFADNGQFEVIAGPGENQITCKDWFGHSVPGAPDATYDVIIDVDPNSGIATVSKQDAWHCDTWGCPYGTGRVDGGGFVFSCSGTISLVLEHTVDLGSFGQYAIVCQKVSKKTTSEVQVNRAQNLCDKVLIQD